MKNKNILIFITALMMSACNSGTTSSINNQSSVNSPNQTSSIISSVEESSSLTSSNASSSSESSSSSYFISSEESSVVSSVISDSSSFTNEVSSSQMDSSNEVSSSSTELSSPSDEKVLYLLTGKVVDTNDNGVSGITVRLYNTTYSMDSTTLENGGYSFSNLEVGTYYLMLMLQDGYELNSSQSNLIVNVEGENTTIQYSDIVVKKNTINWGTLS